MSNNAVLVHFISIFVSEIKTQHRMFAYQFPNWLVIGFFVVLLSTAIAVGVWLVKNDRNYNGF